MTRIRSSALVLCLALAGSLSALPLQAATPTPDTTAGSSRQQIKMDRAEFLRSHVWDESSEAWRLRAGFEPPEGVKSRSDVRAARDTFVMTHRWDQMRGGWVDRSPAAASISAMSREQVRVDTRRFMRTHRWDEAAEAWVDRSLPAKPQ